jgi:choline kinase
MILLILASGSGERLKHKTKNIPKCLVKVNGKPIIEYMDNFINCFEKVYIVAGYKSNKIKKFYKNKNVVVIYNKNYNKTNMVHSIFCASKYIKDDVVISYSDIIFDYSIFKLLKKKVNLMPIKKDWLKIWKKRMSHEEINKDAEDLVIKKNKLISIGNKINKILPKYQFMGLIKIIYKDLLKMKKFYIKLNNKKIDFTSFINLMLLKNKISINCIKTNKFWHEIDTYRDLILANKILKKKYL